MHSRFSLFLAVVLSLVLIPPHLAPAAALAGPLRIGAVFPLRGPLAPLAREEYLGVEIARDLVNAHGGVGGRKLALERVELDAPVEAPLAMEELRSHHVAAVIGAYSSALSIPAAQAAARAGLVYWEAGAVADRLTGQGLPDVFRVGASGSDLGTNSARFAAQQLAPRLHESPDRLRLAVVNARDDYAISVADAAIREALRRHMRVAVHAQYDPNAPRWQPVLHAIQAARPDVLILASHIQDGVNFRRAMLRAHLYVKAFIGSTMAQCVPEFGALMGREAIGVFASDRPPGGFNPRVLSGPARALYGQLAAAWYERTGQRKPSEEGLAGFSAAWALFADVLPRAARRDALSAAGIAAAARSLNLPSGSLPNGAGVRFARDRHHLGQNLRASAVIWQWQGVRHSVVVWPKLYATGSIKLVPMPR